MISLDTNLLFYALNRDCEEHRIARAFLEECAQRNDVAICELILVELYQLLRNATIIPKPYDAKGAVQVCQSLRTNPHWALIESAPVMDQVWEMTAQKKRTRRWIFDARIALTLQHHGVTEFATRNIRDFEAFDFNRVWDPIGET